MFGEVLPQQVEDLKGRLNQLARALCSNVQTAVLKTGCRSEGQVASLLNEVDLEGVVALRLDGLLLRTRNRCVDVTSTVQQQVNVSLSSAAQQICHAEEHHDWSSCWHQV